VQSTSDLTEAAKNVGAANAAGALTFRGRTDNPNLRLGQLIDASAEGLGSTVTRTDNVGKYRIISLTHEVDEEGNYQNYFVAVPHALTLPPGNPYATVPPAQPELAEVVDVKDPKKLGRLRVRYYWAQARPADAESDWIRVTTPYSGDGKGQLFVPEVGSQVLVAYEHNRPDMPVVLGNLFHANNKQKASYSPTGNAVKGIQTASGNKITFHDKAGEEKILISSGKKKGTKLEVSFAKDGSIALTTEGTIVLEAGKEITLKSEDITIAAKNKLELQGKTVSVQAQTTLEATGQQVEVKAKASLALAGQTGAKLNGATVDVAGQTMTTLKGAIVKIN
jgi:uncharacterized protein involved in type VI secretion and phage assembly